MKKLLLVSLVGVLLVVGLAGCSMTTNAGPFVTNIAYDGEGNLLVTKNTVVLNAFMGTIHNGENPQTIVIKAPKKE